MSCNKTNCIISLGLTIMDRCPECEKQEREAKEQHSAELLRSTPGMLAPVVDAKTLREFVEENKATLPCGCLSHLPGDWSFFVGCSEGSKYAYLLGPYDTHEEALANVERGRRLASDADPKAHWYSFGTCSIEGPTERKGVFGK